MDKVNQKMRKFNLRGVLTNLRSSVTASQKQEAPVEEGLKGDNFQISKVLLLTVSSAFIKLENFV